jgi:hypothetical protein
VVIPLRTSQRRLEAATFQANDCRHFSHGAKHLSYFGINLVRFDELITASFEIEREMTARPSDYRHSVSRGERDDLARRMLLFQPVRRRMEVGLGVVGNRVVVVADLAPAQTWPAVGATFSQFRGARKSQPAAGTMPPSVPVRLTLVA